MPETTTAYCGCQHRVFPGLKPVHVQFMPLVGVPSFIEFSRRRDLRCFFVTIRRPDVAAIMCADDAQAVPSVLAPSIVEQPTDAFRDTAGGEPWGSLLGARSPAVRAHDPWQEPLSPSLELRLQEFEMPGAQSSTPKLGVMSHENTPPEGQLPSQELAENAVLAPPTPTKLEIKRAESVSLPYNYEVSKSLSPTPLLSPPNTARSRK
jgi:hypothetical protein